MILSNRRISLLVCSVCLFFAVLVLMEGRRDTMKTGQTQVDKKSELAQVLRSLRGIRGPNAGGGIFSPRRRNPQPDESGAPQLADPETRAAESQAGQFTPQRRTNSILQQRQERLNNMRNAERQQPSSPELAKPETDENPLRGAFSRPDRRMQPRNPRVPVPPQGVDEQNMGRSILKTVPSEIQPSPETVAQPAKKLSDMSPEEIEKLMAAEE